MTFFSSLSLFLSFSLQNKEKLIEASFNRVQAVRLISFKKIEVADRKEGRRRDRTEDREREIDV